jgi:hypothetical protein
LSKSLDERHRFGNRNRPEPSLLSGFRHPFRLTT